MKTQVKDLKAKRKTQKRFSWVVRAADRRARQKLPAGQCQCK
jgi:hypothetical protein